ncbi:hypothetical protein J6590_021272 [Homalodisca vitripennis]|nr:hypothetical protein J6590_021272 [Homalodisca vitripennis]
MEMRVLPKESIKLAILIADFPVILCSQDSINVLWREVGNIIKAPPLPSLPPTPVNHAHCRCQLVSDKADVHHNT